MNILDWFRIPKSKRPVAEIVDLSYAEAKARTEQEARQ